MAELNIKNVGLTTGVFLAVLHTLGFIGLRLGLMDYWSWTHMFSFAYTIEPFNLLAFVAGVLTAFVVGSLSGVFFTIVYNSLNK